MVLLSRWLGYCKTQPPSGPNTTSAQPSNVPLSQPNPTGDGIRSIKTTSVFQALNFELYAKPNMVVMVFGVVAILCSSAYIAYMRASMSGTKTYVAINEDGSQTLMKSKSKWD